jgi:hypothetical protein
LENDINNNIEIYVYLLGEGTDVWRPVQAKKLSDKLFRIVSQNTDPENEKWQFSTGDIVKCEERILSNSKKCLVAVEKI